MLTIRRTRRWTKSSRSSHSSSSRAGWLAGGGDRLTEEARNIIKKELGDYLETGRVWLWYGEVKPGQSALAQAESMTKCDEVEINIMEPGTLLQAIAFTMMDKKSDGRRYYLALETDATVKTPQT